MTKRKPQIGAPDGLSRLMAEARRHPPGDGDGCAPLALLLDDGGELVTARTVRTATAGLGACALRVALARARAAGAGAPAVVLVYWPHRAGTPCGPCRQSFLELTEGLLLHLAGGDGPPRSIAREALMPEPFLEFRGERRP